ncbi:MAG: EF-P lysine aminoacylase GenX [Gammaproteobacteria bacterium]|nr:EF-P lysine aminoacylase GenX [Gammaproteobacteria bacterium]
MNAPREPWRPGATRAALGLRAARLATARAFFAARGVLEVDTPVLVRRAVSDPHIHCARVQLPGCAETLYLHTSPEYAMKRLLAAGCGDIYQICHVVRGEECGRQHNAEFTLIEWYRLGFGIDALMDEVELLVRSLAAPAAAAPAQRVSYQQAFVAALGVDPLAATEAELRAAAARQQLDASAVAGSERALLLDLLMGLAVGPTLGRGAPCFVHRYPASQAALARLDPADARVALRFELYVEGMELANGFVELADAAEQQARFEQEQHTRAARGLPALPVDERLLAALAAGLPDCAGVALGFDRLLMLAGGVPDIGAVMPFTIANA